MKKILQFILIICLGCSLSACDMSPLPKCDSAFVEKEVIEIFKQNDTTYQALMDLEPKLRVVLQTPQATNYNKDIEKYSCKGSVQVLPPNEKKEFEEIGYFDRPFKRIECYVEYEITKSRGEVIVSASICPMHDEKTFIIGKKQGHNMENNFDMIHYSGRLEWEDN